VGGTWDDVDDDEEEEEGRVRTIWNFCGANERTGLLAQCVNHVVMSGNMYLHCTSLSIFALPQLLCAANMHATYIAID
jgi:hypothetical protein